MLAFIFLFWIYPCGHTRRLCLPLFSVSGSIFVGTRGYRACLYLYIFRIGIRSTTLLTDRSLLAHVNGVSALLQRFGWDDQYLYFLVQVSYCCTVSTRVAGDEVSVSPILQNSSRVVLMLNFGLVSLSLLVNNRSDKPSKS